MVPRSFLLPQLLALGLSLPFAAVSADGEKAGHILAKKGDMPAPGVTHEIMIAASHDNIVGQGQMGPEVIEVKGRRKDRTVERLEGLGQGKMRRTLLSFETNGEMEAKGMKRPAPQAQDAFLQIPMILTRSGSGWSAGFEKEAPAHLPPAATKALAAEFDKEASLALCGNEARKPGDRWEAEPSLFSSAMLGKSMLADAKMKGKIAVEFVEVKEIGGTPCAVLSIAFDLAGGPAEGFGPQPDMKAKGSGEIHRSLNERVNLAWQLKGKMEVADPPGAPSKNKMSSDFTIVGETKVTRK